MLPETFSDLTVFLAQAAPSARGKLFHPPDNVAANIEIVLRWIHILAGSYGSDTSISSIWLMST